ncbi:MAG TPA: hypothetical protein VKZ42_05360 [Flavobacteriaceae bacterium]|nr:hypothetical protein [Flavobacteriaceae bacterium]
MKLWYLSIILCFGAVVSHAQIDNSSGFGVPINATDSNTSNSTIILNESKGLSNSKSYLNSKENKVNLDSEKEKELDMTTDNGLLTKKWEYKPSWLTKDKEILESYKNDQNLGRFSTKSKKLEILCRDNQYVDGDKVRIIVNDEVMVHTVHLREDFQVFEIDLKPGNNIIQFQALNQGSSGPNTAHFKVYNENGLITESEWNLLTGAKGNLIIIFENY